MNDLGLHKLANEGGFGAARAAIKAAGHWDENAETGQLKTFKVRVEYKKTVEDWMVLDIEAVTQEEALQLAREEAIKNGDGFDYIDEIERVTIEQPAKAAL